MKYNSNFIQGLLDAIQKLKKQGSSLDARIPSVKDTMNEFNPVQTLGNMRSNDSVQPINYRASTAADLTTESLWDNPDFLTYLEGRNAEAKSTAIKTAADDLRASHGQPVDRSKLEQLEPINDGKDLLGAPLSDKFDNSGMFRVAAEDDYSNEM